MSSGFFTALENPRVDVNFLAIVETWIPGETEGESVADILLGKENPGGKLPISYYAFVLLYKSEHFLPKPWIPLYVYLFVS